MEFQRHGYEVDLVGARADRLVLASVKSYLGSEGVKIEHVSGATTDESASKRYALLNNRQVRAAVIRAAAERYGYRVGHVELRLYVGKFAGRGGAHESGVRAWAGKQRAGAGPIRVFNLHEVVAAVRPSAVPTEYRDNAVLVTVKVLDAAGMLRDDDA